MVTERSRSHNRSYYVIKLIKSRYGANRSRLVKQGANHSED